MRLKSFTEWLVREKGPLPLLGRGVLLWESATVRPPVALSLDWSDLVRVLAFLVWVWLVVHGGLVLVWVRDLVKVRG